MIEKNESKEINTISMIKINKKEKLKERF